MKRRNGVSHAVEVSSVFSAASGDLARVAPADGEAARERGLSSCASPDGSRDASALDNVSMAEFSKIERYRLTQMHLLNLAHLSSPCSPPAECSCA